MSDLVDRLEMTAAMISMGERIGWGTDSALMYEAAAEIERLRAALVENVNGTRISEHSARPSEQTPAQGT